MKQTLKIIPYKNASASCKALKDSLNSLGVLTKRVPKESKTYKLRKHHKFINWGCTEHPKWLNTVDVLNMPSDVKNASNKLRSFELFQDGKVNTPEWTTDVEIAKEWATKSPVVCRTVLNGSGGVGIVIANSPDEVCNAPLYVKYKKKKAEFRIHVFNGKVIDVQQKRKRTGTESNPLIRNLENGWVFCRETIQLPDSASEQAILAVAALGLQFGAVDVIYNQLENTTYVLEVNTAPGLEGQTIQSYANAIKEYFSENSNS